MKRRTSEEMRKAEGGERGKKRCVGDERERQTDRQTNRQTDKLGEKER